ncbi:MAG: TlpA family protein disulfide reductase [Acidobacteria bacterium]|nr:TlpA family protein disulfide reductase [Acidobacteriota bacterium]
MKIAAIVAVCLVVVAAIAIGLTQAGSENKASTAAPSLATAQKQLAGSPPRLAALHSQANELLPGALPALKARVKSLSGYPVIVNVWASWCGPCRLEMPTLQQVSAQRGKEVAFIGVNLKDNVDAARRFIRSFPVTYPSYEDPDGKIFNYYGLAGAPSTVFYKPDGTREYVHSGPYRSAAELNRDIDRYALGR